MIERPNKLSRRVAAACRFGISYPWLSQAWSEEAFIGLNTTVFKAHMNVTIHVTHGTGSLVKRHCYSATVLLQACCKNYTVPYYAVLDENRGAAFKLACEGTKATMAQTSARNLGWSNGRAFWMYCINQKVVVSSMVLFIFAQSTRIVLPSVKDVPLHTAVRTLKWALSYEVHVVEKYI